MSESRPGFVVGYRTWTWDPGREGELHAAVINQGSGWNSGGVRTTAQCNGKPFCTKARPAEIREIKTSAKVSKNKVAVVARYHDIESAEEFPLAPFSASQRGQLEKERAIANGCLQVIKKVRDLTGQRRNSKPPQMDHSCGLHAWFDLEKCIHYESATDTRPTGAIIGWGRTVIYPGEGFRCEFARPIALVKSEHAFAEKLANAYGVPLIDRTVLGKIDTLRAFASEFAERPSEADEAPNTTAQTW